MKSSTTDIPIQLPKYHFRHEKGRAHFHLPLRTLVLSVFCIALLISTSVVLAYKLIERIALDNVRATERLSLIRPSMPNASAPTKAPSASATPTPAARIVSYNTGLSLDPGLQQILDTYNANTPPSGVVVLD